MTIQARIEKFMSPHPLAMRFDQTAGEASRVLLENGFTCLPVVDSTGRLCGIVSATDLLRDGEAVSDERPLLELMSWPVLTVQEQGAIGDAARAMMGNHIHHLIVLSGRHRPVGLISTTDVVRAVAERGLTQPVSRIMSYELLRIDAGTDVAEARAALSEAGMTAAAVSDDAEIVGTVDQLALLGAKEGLRVDEVMDCDVPCVHTRASISEVAGELAERGLRRVFVVDDAEEVIGIVTLTDFVRLAAGLSDYDAPDAEEEAEEEEDLQPV